MVVLVCARCLRFCCCFCCHRSSSLVQLPPCCHAARTTLDHERQVRKDQGTRVQLVLLPVGSSTLAFDTRDHGVWTYHRYACATVQWKTVCKSTTTKFCSRAFHLSCTAASLSRSAICLQEHEIKVARDVRVRGAPWLLEGAGSCRSALQVNYREGAELRPRCLREAKQQLNSKGLPTGHTF